MKLKLNLMVEASGKEEKYSTINDYVRFISSKARAWPIGNTKLYSPRAEVTVFTYFKTSIKIRQVRTFAAGVQDFEACAH